MMAPHKEDDPQPVPPEQVPKAVVSRLSLYLRELEHLDRLGHATTSSGRLGQTLGFTDAQVRKDLAHFGQFGYPGIGYRTEELLRVIRTILGTNQRWDVALVGAGNLGRALLKYRGFEERGFRIAAVFDTDLSKVGTQLEGFEILDASRLSEIIKSSKMKLAAIAVPAPAAQEVANRLAAAGIQGILNFAPVTINLPNGIRIISVDLAIEFEQLAFAVVNRFRVDPAEDPSKESQTD
ncbi:Redox-sensing transcriptional repressor Rex [Planctomycetales bacterium 10988]|nr:Redox-sensing transcriptional repressor Rex [Planctomycetales bacterium 10988]